MLLGYDTGVAQGPSAEGSESACGRKGERGADEIVVCSGGSKRRVGESEEHKMRKGRHG